MIKVANLKGFDELDGEGKDITLKLGESFISEGYTDKQIEKLLGYAIQGLLTIKKSKVGSPEFNDVTSSKNFLLYMVDSDTTLSDEHKLVMKKIINESSPEELDNIIATGNIDDVLRINKQPKEKNDIFNTPFGGIPTIVESKNFYSNMKNSYTPSNKKEIAIRRQSLISIFKNRAEFLFDEYLDNRMVQVIKEFGLNNDESGLFNYETRSYFIDEHMKFLTSLGFYFDYDLTNSMLCDLTNQACSYVYNQMYAQLSRDYSRQLNPEENNNILTLTNIYGETFWGILIQLNKEAHKYYYNMGIPDFQDSKKLN